MASRDVIVRLTCAIGAAGLASALVVGACRSAASPAIRAPAGASSIAGANEAPPASSPWETGMPPMHVVLDDPRLAGARQREGEGDHSAAAREVQRVRSTAPLDPERACTWSYLAGRLFLEAGKANDAAAAFDAAGADGGSDCRLGPYARLRQAQALVRAGRADDALAALRGLGDDPAVRDEARLATADALVVKGDRAAAIPLWRLELAEAPHGLRWVDSSLELARALLDGAGGAPASNAREAFDRVTRVIVEAPAAAEKLQAGSLRDRAAAAMGLPAARRLTSEERTRQARAWLDASQPKRARELADGVLAALARTGPDPGGVGCKAATVRAQATARGRSEDAAEAWAVAIARCREGSDADAYAVALYQGGKASASAKRFSEALARFQEVERRFPAHRLADDARLRAALVVDEQGDRARSLAMLASVADVYPGGDMGPDALFRVALAKLDQADLAGARAILDRLLATPARQWSWGSAARAEYFRARVAELAGDMEDARARYAALVASRPLSYFMRLAFSRLKAIDAPFALSTIEGAIRAEPAGPFLTVRHPELESAAFQRFVQLLEVGEIEAARREAAAGGLMSETTDSQVLWTIGWLFDRAGAPEIGHAFGRSRLIDYRSHWPSGRWRLAWEVAFPRPWAALVARESDASGVPASLTWAVMREESAFDPEARSSANAIGLMQLMGPTAQQVAHGTSLGSDERSLRRPDVSIALGSRLLSSLRASFPDRPELAIAAYNGGAAAVRRWLQDRGDDQVDVFVEHITFDETRNYVKRVLASQASYAYLYAPAPLDGLAVATGSRERIGGAPPAAAGADAAPIPMPAAGIAAPAAGGATAPPLAAGRALASTPTAVSR